MPRLLFPAYAASSSCLSTFHAMLTMFQARAATSIADSGWMVEMDVLEENRSLMIPHT